MNGEILETVLEYLRANPEVAQQIKAYALENPEEVRAMFVSLADEMGWDLSQIDIEAVKAALAEVM